MRDPNSDHEDSVSEEEQQMANALLSPTPGVSFPQLPEIPRRSSKRPLSENSVDPSQSEKRRKALTLLVETRTAKSLKLADPDKVTFLSEPNTKDCFSISSGIYLPFLLLCLHILVKKFADQHFIFCRFRSARLIFSFLWLFDEEHPHSLWVRFVSFLIL